MIIEYKGKAVNFDFVCEFFKPGPELTKTFSIYVGLNNGKADTWDFDTADERDMAYRIMLEQLKVYKLLNKDVK
jgi:hypothetical protein